MEENGSILIRASDSGTNKALEVTCKQAVVATCPPVARMLLNDAFKSNSSFDPVNIPAARRSIFIPKS